MERDINLPKGKRKCLEASRVSRPSFHFPSLKSFVSFRTGKSAIRDEIPPGSRCDCLTLLTSARCAQTMAFIVLRGKGVGRGCSHTHRNPDCRLTHPRDAPPKWRDPAQEAGSKGEGASKVLQRKYSFYFYRSSSPALKSNDLHEVI